MHTTKANLGSTFIHNGDYSGDLIISVPADKVKEVPDPTGAWVHINLPFEDIKQLVADYVRERTITALEQANDDDVLFMEWTVRDD
jgi:hypothetical protein